MTPVTGSIEYISQVDDPLEGNEGIMLSSYLTMVPADIPPTGTVYLKAPSPVVFLQKGIAKLPSQPLSAK
jgi:hypothetical protein